MAADADLVDYYRRRAAEYERIYDRPERAGDLARLSDSVPRLFSGRRVLEIACGTGWWTERIARPAAHVTALDAARETLELAACKPLPPGRVTLLVADAFALPFALGTFDALFAGFFWSHVPRRRLRSFLAGLCPFLEPDARVVFLDNRYVEGSSTPIDHVDAAGDSWQRRRLADGSSHAVLKNFPTQREIADALAPFCRAVECEWLEYYWTASALFAGAPQR